MSVNLLPRFFIDTANIEDIRKAISWGVFSGITTNPVLLARESADPWKHVRKIIECVPDSWEISVQVMAKDGQDLVTQARNLRSWDKRIRVKIPATLEGMVAAACIIREMPLNLTIIKSAAQAGFSLALPERNPDSDILFSIFWDRIRQAGYSPELVFSVFPPEERRKYCLAASVKSPADIGEILAIGVGAITAPLSVYASILESPIIFEDHDSFAQAYKPIKI